MGSFTAVGGVKAGEKSVTAFETADCGTALAIAKFKSYAKPGGSDFVVSVSDYDMIYMRFRPSAIANILFSCKFVTILHIFTWIYIGSIRIAMWMWPCFDSLPPTYRC